jgi:hypothetical protein
LFINITVMAALEGALKTSFIMFCLFGISLSIENGKLQIYIYIKSKGNYQPENLMSNGSSRHDDAAQTK